MRKGEIGKLAGLVYGNLMRLRKLFHVFSSVSGRGGPSMLFLFIVYEFVLNFEYKQQFSSCFTLVHRKFGLCGDYIWHADFVIPLGRFGECNTTVLFAKKFPHLC